MGVQQPIRVVLAGRLPVVRAGIRSILASASDIEVVGEATNTEAARLLCCELEPDVLILDPDMPKNCPFEVVLYLREHCSQTKVLVLSSSEQEENILTFFGLGVHGYIIKDEETEHVPATDGTSAPDTTDDTLPAEQDDLTKREIEVLQLIAGGMTAAEVAERLVLSTRTVQAHVRSIYTKLGVTSRSAVTRYAIERGLL